MEHSLQEESWHLDKKVPIGIIIALIIQSITFFSIAVAWKTTVDGRLSRLEELSADSANQSDRIIILEQQLKYIVESLNRIETKLNIVEQGRAQ